MSNTVLFLCNETERVFWAGQIKRLEEAGLKVESNHLDPTNMHSCIRYIHKIKPDVLVIIGASNNVTFQIYQAAHQIKIIRCVYPHVHNRTLHKTIVMNIPVSPTELLQTIQDLLNP
jgi:predicted SpoU family rRNA methylase